MKGLIALIVASMIVVFGVSVPTAEANPPHPTITGPVAVAYHEVVALSGQTPEPQVRVTAFIEEHLREAFPRLAQHAIRRRRRVRLHLPGAARRRLLRCGRAEPVGRRDDPGRADHHGA